MIQSSLFAEPGRPGRGSAGGAVVRICRESDWYRSYSCGHMSFLDVMATP